MARHCTCPHSDCRLTLPTIIEWSLQFELCEAGLLDEYIAGKLLGIVEVKGDAIIVAVLSDH